LQGNRESVVQKAVYPDSQGVEGPPSMEVASFTARILIVCASGPVAE
jgi:hypothetical protein